MAHSNPIWANVGHCTIGVDTLQALSNKAPGLLLGTLLFYLFYKYTRRIYFHPLSSIPGPRLAAATHLYEAYYNILRQGLSKRVIQLHETYS
jgi:hypothetical protein